MLILQRFMWGATIAVGSQRRSGVALNLGIAQPPLHIQASSGALPDLRGGFKHVPRVRLYMPHIVRGACGNRTHVDHVQAKRLNR